MKAAVLNMTCLDKSYLEGSIQKKRQIIGSIFPEKLSFDKSKGRTGRVNEAVRLIYTLDKGFSEIKKPDSSKKMPEPGEVTLIGLMSNHFLSDLKLLASLCAWINFVF